MAHGWPALASFVGAAAVERNANSSSPTASGNSLSVGLHRADGIGSGAASGRPTGITSIGRAPRCARVENPFHVVKRLWGFTKVRYRGLAKNTVRIFALFTLANLYRLRHRLVQRPTAA